MQQLLDLCKDYGAANGIAFNPVKSVCLNFKARQYKLFYPRLLIGNAQLEYVYDALYLAFIFCENIKDNSDKFKEL